MGNGETEYMEKELYSAAVKGNVELLLLLQQTQLISGDDEYLLQKTIEKNNMIHIATRHEQHHFIEEFLKRFPNKKELVCERNSHGNTPLHVAAEVGNLDIMRMLYDYSAELLEGDNDEKPWRMRNTKGNTPLHVAIMHDNVKVARSLLEKDVYLARIVNDSNEAPLHLAIKHHVDYYESEAIKSRLKQPIVMGRATSAIKYAPGENMSSLINFLVEKESCVTCWPDAQGLTPLHRAASLSIPYNLQIVKLILYHCPQSAEVCDSTGKTVLHHLVCRLPSYQEGKGLVKCKDINFLRNCQDNHGNTPLHIAAMNKDILMIRALLDSSAKLSIINKEGVSAASLIQQQNLLEMLTKRRMAPEESEAATRGDVTFLRDKMSKLGVDYFLLSQDSEGRNLLHKLMHIETGGNITHDDFIDFIQQILGSCPALICQTDINGDTPIHVLVRNHPYSRLRQSGISSALLELFNECILKLKEDANNNEESGSEELILPWVVQNAQGNAPIHEAIIAHNITCARRLLAYDLRSAGLVNQSKEAPIHLIARYVTDEHFQKEEVELMVKAKPEAALWLDKGGLTPVLIAFQVGNIFTATELCNLSPAAAGICNASGQTFWHLLMNHPSGYFVYRLLQNSALRNLLKLRDNEYGNTPLHLAIEGNRFDLMKDFLQVWGSECKSSNSNNDQWLVELLHIPNKAGKTPADLLGESPCLPSNIERCIWDRDEMIGVRSLWGIPTTQMNTYVNTIGIIAALLTTITFTAAFSVPGGLIQDTGTPLLIGHTSFQLFMVSDITAMCLSVVVLFCLLWIMATSDRRNSVMILDFSISLLLGSFFATLLTFMTGLYATTFPVRPWIAIVTLVLCSLLILLVHKCLVIRLLIPFGKAVMIFYRVFWKYIGGLGTNIMRCCKRNTKRSVGDHDQFGHQPSLNNV